MRSYAEYQECPHEWLGQVPSHWSVLPNRALFREVKDQNHPEEPLLSVTISQGVIPQEILLAGSSKKDASNRNKSKYKLVEPGDIAYNKMRAWQGALGVSVHRGIVSPAYIVVRPRQQVDARYFHYLLRTPDFVKEAERWSYGITSDMWSLRYEDFKQIYCVQPPLDEQRQMAQYLDQQNRRANRLIRVKQRLITLLNEQKQAIVQRAVRRGLDPDVPLKPSGVDWLGDVPKHWEVLRLGYAIRLTMGFPFSSRGYSDHPGDTRLLRGVNVTPGAIRWAETMRWPRSQYEYFSEYHLREGDIVLGMDRTVVASGVRAAKLQEADVPSLLLQRVARLRPTERLRTDYLLLLLHSRSFMDYLFPLFTGISVPHLSPKQLASFVIALPPLAEQDDILNDVQERTQQLEDAVTTTQSEIDLIREYCTRLIADVVTGKLDVRGVALPEVGGDGATVDLDIAADEEPLLEEESPAYADH